MGSSLHFTATRPA